MPAAALPIDEVLAQVVATLGRERRLVLIAPPGAGKTTRVPPALLDAGMAAQGEIAVLQPRRLAARMAAERVAAELGERVGQTVGYEVRFDRHVGPDTRIRFVTEGVLTRQLISDPTLARTSVVLIDEFHERHLAGDLALALLRRLQQTSRPDLVLAVMSATLDPGPVASFLGNAPVVESAGRMFPVDIEYAPARAPSSDEPLEKQVAAALRRVVQHGLDGDALVFLPGAAEIRRCMEACADIAARQDLLLVPLHGDLPAAEQDRALAPARQRKVILATNVAETSVTIAGVVCVIDSGLARVARHSPWSGMSALRIEPISKASAAQRAGRAGRTRPGRCIRLYDRHDHDTRRAFDTPEVMRADLADTVLALHGWGLRQANELAWLDAPPAAALTAAEELLARLGAVDESGALTPIGTRMLRFPVHPRQARMIVEAEDRGVASEGCTLAALVGQREIRLSRRTSMRGGKSAAVVSGPSDLLEDMDALEATSGQRGDRLRAQGLDPTAASAVVRTRDKLARLARDRISTPAGSKGAKGTKSPHTSSQAAAQAIDDALLIVTLAGYPDRVGRRRRPGSDEIVLAGGGSATLAAESVVTGAALVVAVEAEEHGRGTRISRASEVRAEWLLDLYIDRIRETDELVWLPERARVERVSRMYYDDLVIDEQWDPAGARHKPEQAAEILARAAVAAGIDRFVDREALDAWRARLGFAAQVTGKPELAPPSDSELEAALAELCVGLTSFADLARVPIVDAMRARLSAEEQALIDRLAPTHVSLPGRKRVPVSYESDRPPWIASRLQDFFGLSQGPAIAGGNVPLVLHLLAPNQRAVQVTSDLAGFWSRHYPELRRQLMRRYPRHAWPEDPLTGHSR